MLSDAFLQFEQEEKEREALEEGESSSNNNNNNNNNNATQNNSRKLFETKKENKDVDLRLLKETWYHWLTIHISDLPNKIIMFWYLLFPSSRPKLLRECSTSTLLETSRWTTDFTRILLTSLKSQRSQWRAVCCHCGLSNWKRSGRWKWQECAGTPTTQTC